MTGSETNTTETTVLAVAPGVRHLGVALMENGALLFFGVKTFAWRRDARSLVREAARYMQGLVAKHRAALLALEDTYYVQAERSAQLRSLISGLKCFGEKRGLPVVACLPTRVKRHFCPRSKATRAALASQMVLRYPFLTPFFKKQRNRAYWQQMFDAVGLAAYVTCRMSNWRKCRAHRDAANASESAADSQFVERQAGMVAPCQQVIWRY